MNKKYFVIIVICICFLTGCEKVYYCPNSIVEDYSEKCEYSGNGICSCTSIILSATKYDRQHCLSVLNGEWEYKTYVGRCYFYQDALVKYK